jgi:hypothetical protein
MKIHCQLEANDLLEAQLLHIRPRPMLKWLGLLTLLIFTVGTIIHIIITPIRSVSWTPLCIFGVIAYLVFYHRVLLPKHSLKIFTQRKGLHLPYDIEITEDMYSAESERGNSRFPWSDFHKYKQNNSTILLYQSDGLFNIFRKHWFTDEQFMTEGIVLQSQSLPTGSRSPSCK